MAKAFYGRLAAYDVALSSEDDDAAIGSTTQPVP